jgi:glycogen debranching enzyme
LTVSQINHILFRCDTEERDIVEGRGPYGLKSSGSFKYAGLAGVVHVIRQKPDLGHELFQNVREGDWLLDYIFSRLQDGKSQHGDMEPLIAYMQDCFACIKKLDPTFKPQWFVEVISKVYTIVQKKLLGQLNPLLARDPFMVALAQGIP